MVFSIHILSFACLNALVGYLLLHREQPGTVSLSFFFIAMGVDFLVNDYGLRRHHQERYNRIGARCWPGASWWVMASAFDPDPRTHAGRAVRLPRRRGHSQCH